MQRIIYLYCLFNSAFWHWAVLSFALSGTSGRSFLPVLLYLPPPLPFLQSFSLYLLELLRISTTFSTALFLSFKTSHISFFLIFFPCIQFPLFSIMPFSYFNFRFVLHKSMVEADHGRSMGQHGLKRNFVMFLLFDIDSAPSNAAMARL